MAPSKTLGKFHLALSPADVSSTALRERDTTSARRRPQPASHRKAARAFRVLPGTARTGPGENCGTEMDRRQFWPAIYHVNDHGNVTLLSGTGREIAAWV